ncbi:uncharacterized protein [Pseudorasbora parva]|uniref:uncharacterized protein n=1 Tax=Pseudorasbora parva TaxID=51549 RepID=UPI00351DB8B2
MSCRIPQPQTPTLSLVPVITEKSTFALCVIENFYPKNLTVQWKVKDKSHSVTKLEYKCNAKGLYTAHSLYEVSSDNWNTNANYICEATHQETLINVTKNFKAKLTLTLKPPFVKTIFVENAVVLEAVVSGDVEQTVENTAMSCKNVSETSDGRVEFSKDMSQYTKKYNVTIDTKKWFDGEIITCTIPDPNNNRDIEKNISFNRGDGQTPSVSIYTPDKINTDSVSLVCEVTSRNLGDVYMMWKVSKEPYIEGRTSAPILRENSTSVHSILTMSKQQYEDKKTIITCAVKHANMKNTDAPLQVSTSLSKLTLTLKPPFVKTIFVENAVVLEAVVSGDVEQTVENTTMSCKNVSETSAGRVEFSKDMSQYTKKYNVTIDTKKWFDGEIITCTIPDPNNNRDIEKNISFNRGDGQTPSVSIFTPDKISTDSVSLVCEVTSRYLGDVYMMWKVSKEPYIEGRTSAPILRENSTSVHSILTMSKQQYEDKKTIITCAVKHANMKNTDAPLQVSTSLSKLTLTLKPPFVKTIFVENAVVLEAVVSGDVEQTVENTAMSCKNVSETSDGRVEFSKDMSQYTKKYNVTIDTKKWFDGEIITCTIPDPNNNRDIEKNISFNRGDGQTPSVSIYTPDKINTDSVSLVCEVTSRNLGDVYMMWKVSKEPYIEGRTSAPILRENSTSVHSILTMSKQQYEDKKTIITCAVKHANMKNTDAPLQVSTSLSKLTLTLKPPFVKTIFVENAVVLEAVVSGDVEQTVENTAMSCKNVSETSNGRVEFSKDMSQYTKKYNVTIDTKKWFDGEIITCTIPDPNNNRDIEKNISFNRGDGQTPSVSIYTPDKISTDSVSLVCEVTSRNLGDVYMMWKVSKEPYIEGRTSAPILRENSTSVHSILTMSKQQYEDKKTIITCAVKHANMKNTDAPLQVSTSLSKLTLTLKPPFVKTIFVENAVVLEAVVSGDVEQTVENTTMSCKNGFKTSDGRVEFSKDMSQYTKKYNVTINTKKWFDGEIITCTIPDPNNNSEIEKNISFNRGDGQTPSVSIYTPDKINTDSVSLVCEVTSRNLGDVYMMWKVSKEPYIEGRTSAPILRENSTSVHSILTMSKQQYEDKKTIITCAVKHANMKNTDAPLQVSTSLSKLTLSLKPPFVKKIFVENAVVLEAVVSGDVEQTVENTAMSCKNGIDTSAGRVEFSKDMSQYTKTYNVTINTKKWFDGEIITCTIPDPNNNRNIEKNISFNRGDGQTPSVSIYRPDKINTDSVSLVCEVTSRNLGDVYMMWKVSKEPYIEGRTSAPILRENSTSVHSILTMSKQQYEDKKTIITCAVKHANMKNTDAPLQVSTSLSKLTLSLKPPFVKKIFVENAVVLEAVVSGDVEQTVENTAMSCKNGIDTSAGRVEFSKDMSQYTKTYNVTINTKKWFDGEIITCTIPDPNNNREIEKNISFNIGDGQTPSVSIYRPDKINTDSVSLVCEVTSRYLGDVYMMWKLGKEPYIEGRTSAPILRENSMSVHSILTMSKQQYEDKKTIITCAVKHANMQNTDAPLQVSTSLSKLMLTLKPPFVKKIFVENAVVLEAVVSGDVEQTVENTTMSCKNGLETSVGRVEFSKDMSQYTKTYNVTINTKKWFDGEIITCTIPDPNNNRNIEKNISFNRGDGQTPSVSIYTPDKINTDSVSLVCEVTSRYLGDVYMMWKVSKEPYIEGRTSAPILRENSMSVHSILTMSKQQYEDKKTIITCAVKHANMKNTDAPLQVSTSLSKLTLTLKPPFVKTIFVENAVVLEAVVSGDVEQTVENTAMSCKNGFKTSDGRVEFSKDMSQYTKKYNVTINTKKWFDGEIITCTIPDPNNNRDIEKNISFNRGDGKTPSVFIYRTDRINTDSVSLVCEVTSRILGDVYMMWKVSKEPYIEGRTSAPILRENSTSVYSILTMSKQQYEDKNPIVTCAVKHANMKNTDAPLQVSTSLSKLTLTLKPPFVKTIFVENAVVLEAVVSGDVEQTVENTTMSCKNGLEISAGRVEFSKDISQYTKTYNVTINTKKWFDGEIITCTIPDPNNNRYIEQEIRFNIGDGHTPSVFIYRPDSINTDSVSLVCEVTSSNLGDVYMMWKVSGDAEPYIEGRTSAPILRENSTSVLSILTMSKQQYEDKNPTVTCAVMHANMKNTDAPLQVSTSLNEPPEPEKGFALNCNKDVLEEDEFRSLWSTATSFIFLFLFSLTYSAVLSLFKVKQ